MRGCAVLEFVRDGGSAREAASIRALTSIEVGDVRWCLLRFLVGLRSSLGGNGFSNLSRLSNSWDCRSC